MRIDKSNSGPIQENARCDERARGRQERRWLKPFSSRASTGEIMLRHDSEDSGRQIAFEFETETIPGTGQQLRLGFEIELRMNWLQTGQFPRP